MKKMNLKHLNLSGADLLSREELKKVLGGRRCGSNWDWGPNSFNTYCSVTFLKKNDMDLAIYSRRLCTNGSCDITAPSGYVLAEQSACFSGDVAGNC